ncbi:MAG: LuxR family DNA-binding response regulator [Limisphaerales bacterium]|nr:MAG: LuxR family DNA-binding response regulator [Limisphaerales bacterium]KAG0507603.1 MAG: LuxR family DNA-binding response regulator [Limisphaerales bacterium]TXT48220.1 MAG: LuxR family DNA-binding response regulator [Limisphaerales bacterium]
MTTIVIAEDHHVVRDGLRALLAAQKDFQLVGEAADGLEAAQLVEKLQPDVLVLDLTLPRLHGLEVARQVKKSSPKTRVLILSMHANEAYVLEALRNDAAGYLLKDSTGAELVRAVRDVVAGRRYLSGSLSELAIQAYIQRKTTDTAQDMYEALTDREREVLHLAAEGLNNPDIARKLFISPRTAETHRANVMRKLNFKTQTDLVRFAIRRGILPM